MTYSFTQVMKDRKLVRALAEAAKSHRLTIVDGNGIFDFDFCEQSLLTNHRRTYDRLMELGGEKLLRKLLKEGNTCLTDDPHSAKQGVRSIQGTDQFFLQTNAGEPKVLTSILFGVAGWAKMDEAFDAEMITINDSDEEEEGLFSCPPESEWAPFDWAEQEVTMNHAAEERSQEQEFVRIQCLKESEDSLFETCIIQKDGWWAVAEIDMRAMPRIHRMCTPFAFTSIVRKENWIKTHLLVERFGKKGVYNWEDNTYPVPCRYDNICLLDEKSCAVYKVSIRDESHVLGFWGGWLRADLPLCPKCGTVQVRDALYCHMCGAHLKGDEKPAQPVAEVKKEEPKPTPASAPQPVVKKEEPKAERKIDPDVPTLDTFGTGKEFFCSGSASHVNHGQLRVTVQYDDDCDYDTDPEHFLYGDLTIKKREKGGERVIWKLSNIADYVLSKDGIFYVKYDQVCFMNIYGEKKILGNQDKVIGMKDDGNGVLTVEYLVDYYQTAYRDYRCPMDMWEIWEDVYKVNTKKREFRY